MAVLTPQYRFSLWKTDGTAVMAPVAGSWHTDLFQVTTENGLAGWQPYLDHNIEEVKSEIDVFERKVNTSTTAITIIDPKGPTNAQRWVTSFVGDLAGRKQFVGLRGALEERFNSADPWVLRSVGYIEKAQLVGKTGFRFTMKDIADDILNTELFIGPPASQSVGSQFTYAPIGFVKGFAGSAPVTPLRGTTTWQAGTLQVDTHGSHRKRNDNVFLINLTNEKPHRNEVRDWHLKKTEVRVRFISSNPADAWHNKEARAALIKLGEKRVDAAKMNFTGDVFFEGKGFSYDWIRMLPLPTTDPAYIALASVPLVNPIDFVVYKKTDKPFGDFGIFINDTNPIDFLEELLKGWFGYQVDGVYISAFEYDLAGVDKTTLPRSRWHITEKAKLGEFIEQHICKPYGLGYRIDAAWVAGKPACVFKLVDMRKSSIQATVGSLPTLSDADLSHDSTPEWNHDANGSAASIKVITHVTPKIDFVAMAWDSKYKDDAEWRKWPKDLFEIETQTNLALDFSNGSNVAQGEFEVEALGLSASEGEVIDGKPAEQWLQDKARDTIDHFWEFVQDGPLYFDGVFLRTSTNAENCFPGNWRVVNVSVYPNPTTRVRGGSRLMQCIGRQPQEGTVKLSFVDLGEASATRIAPSIATITTDDYGVYFNITRNAAADPVEVQYSLTDATVVVEPTTGWSPAKIQIGLSGVPDYRANANGNYLIFKPTRGQKVWVKARSMPPVGSPGFPSGYSSTLNIIYSPIATPTAPTVTAITTKTATLTWTNGNAALATEILLTPTGGTAVSVIAPPGATTFGLKDLDTYGVTTFSVAVRHLGTDGYHGAQTSVAFNTTAASAPATVAPTPVSITITRGTA